MYVLTAKIDIKIANLLNAKIVQRKANANLINSRKGIDIDDV